MVELLSYKQLVGGSNPSPVISLLFLGRRFLEKVVMKEVSSRSGLVPVLQTTEGLLMEQTTHDSY